MKCFWPVILLVLVAATLCSGDEEQPERDRVLERRHRLILLADETRGRITTIAGTGQPDDGGDAGPAQKTNIGEPFGVEIGPDGALYITEVRNHRVRRLDLKSGELTTVAGCGRKGYS